MCAGAHLYSLRAVRSDEALPASALEMRLAGSLVGPPLTDAARSQAPARRTLTPSSRPNWYVRLRAHVPAALGTLVPMSKDIDGLASTGVAPIGEASTDAACDGHLQGPAPDSLVGAVLAGRYRIDRRLGSGGMGTVFAGTHLLLDRSVAVKVMRTQSDAESSLGKRFIQPMTASPERRRLAALRPDAHKMTFMTWSGMYGSGPPTCTSLILETNHTVCRRGCG